MPPISISGSVRTLASHASAPRKVGQEARAFRKASHPHCQPAAGCRQSASAEACEPWLRMLPPQGKSGRKPELSVKPAIRSGVPMPSRWTFASAVRASAHCPAAALSPSGLRLRPEPARGHGHPVAGQPCCLSGSRERQRPDRQYACCCVSSTLPTASRRQDAANQHQRKRANLGFACFRPKESRAGSPSFP